MRTEFAPQGVKVHATEFKYCTLKLLSVFSPDIKPLLKLWGVERSVSAAKSKELLEITYRPAPQSLKEMAYSLYEQGITPDKRKHPKN